MLLQIVAIASSALDEYRVEAKKMVVALVDMERAFIPPQHFIRLVQRRYSSTCFVPYLLPSVHRDGKLFASVGS
jgi:hypothetical protein